MLSKCSDSNENMEKVTNIQPWMLATASRIDYNANGRSVILESSNGKRVGTFETAQSRTSYISSYSGMQVGGIVNVCNLDWLFGQRDDFESSGTLTMLASEAVLRKDWDTPEEDAAWANL